MESSSIRNWQMEQRRVALAFESGGSAEACARTLDVLRGARVRATVFLDGQWAEANPDLVRLTVRDGHELGNHAYSHPDFTTLTDETIAEELERTEALAQQLVGQSTRPWLRPPYQRLDDRVRDVARRLGFRCLVRDALDGAHYLGASTPPAILERSLARAQDGAVLTYHLQSPATVEALPKIVEGLRDRGAEMGAVSDLPATPPERAPLHPDLAALPVDPGYLRMRRSVPPPQMINVLALGADAVARTDTLLPLSAEDGPRAFLLTFNGHEPYSLPAAARARHMVCLAGRVLLEAGESNGQPVCTAWLHAGDTLEIRSGWGASVLPAGAGGRAILLLIG